MDWKLITVYRNSDAEVLIALLKDGWELHQATGFGGGDTWGGVQYLLRRR